MNEAPILDLRVRKAVRRSGARLVVAASHPTALDGGASERLLFAPGAEEALLRALAEGDARDRRTRQADDRERPRGAGRQTGSSRAAAGQEELMRFLADQVARASSPARAGVGAADLRDAARPAGRRGEHRRSLWGERLGHGERGAGALARADRPRAAGRARRRRELGADRGPGRRRTRAACARSAACRTSGPGLADTTAGARRRRGRARPPPAASSSALYLLHCRPAARAARRGALGAGARRGAVRGRARASS